MIFFLALFAMLICYLLPCTTLIRIHLIELLSDHYVIRDFIMFVCGRFLGNLIGIFYFKRFFSFFGALRLITLSVTCLTQASILLLFIKNIKIKIVCVVLFGIFEKFSGSIVTPVTSNAINVSFYKHFDIFSNNLVRLLSGFLLITPREISIPIILCCFLSLLIIYVLSDTKNQINKEHIHSYNTHLIEVFGQMPEYFWCSFISNFLTTTTFFYLAVFLKNESTISAASLVTFYLWGKFIFSYPLEIFVNQFSNSLYSLMICLINIIIIVFHIYTSSFNFKGYFYSFKIAEILSIFLLGGASSLSHKYRFQNLFSKEEHISINVTEDQIRVIASFFASMCCYFFLDISNLTFWGMQITINLINIFYIFTQILIN